MSRLRSMLPAVVIGESIFSSSEIGLGRRRRRVNKSCCDSCSFPKNSGVSVIDPIPGVSIVVSWEEMLKCPYIGVGMRVLEMESCLI